MKIVVFACVPVEPFYGDFRRVRITIDGTKVTSFEYFDEEKAHHSCSHKCNAFRSFDLDQVSTELQHYADRLRNPRAKSFSSRPVSTRRSYVDSQ
jgi:hypothetical protein